MKKNLHLNYNILNTMQGFSLLEMIAVIAIMSIMAGTIAPNMIDGIDRAMSSAETGNLETLASNLTTYIDRTKSIPGSAPSSWSAAIASYSDVPRTHILQNDRHFKRALYFDPHFFTSSNTRFSGYKQSSGLNSEPVSPRMMLVSMLKENAPGAPTLATDFDAIWNQSKRASLIEGNDVIIKRINLSSRFHRVILTNQRSSQTGYRIENGPQVAISAANNGTDGTLTRYIISNSRIQLYGETYPAGNLLSTLLVNGSTSYQFASTTGTNSSNSNTTPVAGTNATTGSRNNKSKKNKKNKKRTKNNED